MIKKSFLGVLFSLLVCSVYGQIEDTAHRGDNEMSIQQRAASISQKAGEKRSRLTIAIKNISKTDEGEQRHNRLLWNDVHWAGIGIHYSGLITNLTHMNLPAGAEFLSQSAKSIGVTLNPIDYTLLKSKHVGLVTGLGVEFNNFRFEENMALKVENGVTVPDYQYQTQNIRLEKSKLYTCYLNVPLLVEVQMGRNNNFFVNAGMVGGWRIGAHTKIKASDPRLSGKFKKHDSFGLRNFHYGYTINIGYNHFALSAVYYRSTLFKNGRGPRVQQINIGLTFLL